MYTAPWFSILTVFEINIVLCMLYYTLYFTAFTVLYSLTDNVSNYLV